MSPEELAGVLHQVLTANLQAQQEQLAAVLKAFDQHRSSARSTGPRGKA